MPEMTDAMYCHQQICVPPTFPYLLRQYAKAAIRSQPTDLLRWSCAYFRALAKGLRPPTKLRLEFPIPKTFYGLTPGWLKTLIFQLAGHSVVSWPQLFDRWRGACLEIEGLQKIILLGGFESPAQIPWLRFVAVAAGHLTTNLTNTMILICELLTDEPEGGSSSIPYSTFADLYKFLAAIDACQTREVKNYWFTESNLDLTKVGSEVAVTGETATTAELDLGEEEYTHDRYSDLERYLKALQIEEVEEDVKSTPKEIVHAPSIDSADDVEPNCYIILDPDDPTQICDEVHSKSSSSSSGTSTVSAKMKVVEQEVGEETIGEASYEGAPSIMSKDESLSSIMESSESIHGMCILTLLPVPGIGGVVKEEIVEAALKYLREVSLKQKGMVMPRNIKHFMCPPLEECLEA